MLVSDLGPGETGRLSKRGKLFTLVSKCTWGCNIRYVDSGWYAWLEPTTQLYTEPKALEGKQLRSFGAFMMKLEGKKPRKKKSWPKATMPEEISEGIFHGLIESVVNYGEWDDLIDAFTWDTHPMENTWCDIDGGRYDNYDEALTEVIGWAIELGILSEDQAQSTFERQRLDILEEAVPW